MTEVMTPSVTETARADFDRLVEEAGEQDAVIAVDTEGTGLRPADGLDYGIGISVASAHESSYIAVRHPAGGNCDGDWYEELAGFIENAKIIFFQNAKYDIHSLASMSVFPTDAFWFDCSVAAQLLDENDPINHDLDSLSRYYLKREGKHSNDYVEAEKKSGNQHITWSEEYEYAAWDARATYDLGMELHRRLQKTGLYKAFEDKIATLKCAWEMERRGVRLDVAKATEMAHTARTRMGELTEELGLNIGSSKQLSELLIDQMGLPVVKMTSGGKSGNKKPSMDKEAMEEYDLILDRLNSPLAKQIKEYRGWQKATTASFEPYLELMGTDGRVRTSYRLDRTVTGRWSSQGPNLQQVPKDSDKPWKAGTKACFIPADGYVLINFDYSQLELRLANVYAPEDSLVQAFAEGRDVFDEMSEQLGMTRQDTKTLTYSMQYGAGVNRIMHAFGVERARAIELRDNYHSTFKRFTALNERCSELARSQGFIETLGGRKRRLAPYWTVVDGVRKRIDPSYKAMNSMIQGGASDIVEATLRRLFREIDDEDECRTLMQVHDAFVFEIREEYVEDYMPEIENIMRDVAGSTGIAELNSVVFDVDGGPDYGSKGWKA